MKILGIPGREVIRKYGTFDTFIMRKSIHSLHFFTPESHYHYHIKAEFTHFPTTYLKRKAVSPNFVQKTRRDFCARGIKPKVLVKNSNLNVSNENGRVANFSGKWKKVGARM